MSPGWGLPEDLDLPPPEAESEALLTRYASGQDSALAKLIDKESPKLRGYLERRIPAELLRRIGVSDVIQQTTIELVRRREQFENRGYGAFRVLLFRIADGLLANALGRERAARRDLRRDLSPGRGRSAALDSAEAAGPSPSEALLSRERIDAMKRAIARLSPDDRRIITLVDYEGLGHESAAQKLKLSVEATRKRYSRALARLRALLGADGVEP